MRGAVASACILALVAFAGCAEEKRDPTVQSDESTSASGSASRTATASGTRSGTGAPTGPVNGTAAAPVANLTADPLNGTAPLDVAFGIGGTGTSWTLTWGNLTLGNGTQFPSNVTYTFNQTGNHTVVLRVVSGASNVTANVTIAVSGGQAPAPQASAEDDWAVFNADGTCDAKGEIALPGGVYVHERGNPPGTGFVAGDGTWVYEESNSLPGLQLGGSDDSVYSACLNPDTLIF